MGSQLVKRNKTLFFFKLFKGQEEDNQVWLFRSDSLGVRKGSGSSPPRVAPVWRRTVASPAGFGLLKITSGEGFFCFVFLSPAGRRTEGAEGNWLFVCSTRRRGNVR